ncbi:hypothetical protein [Burkholderia pseudomallei]|uniref:hypothetical protein n=1 Tax=Burkholderia pseudomallei TaxID=28450 RepID=UPI001FCC9A04|nr:hypothetical protein [Burkholderia pseudomallei]
MYDLFLSRLAAVNNNLEKYMPSGIEVDGISFNELALVNRPEHAAVLGRIFTSWSLIESSITALLGLLFIVRRGYGIPPNPRSHTPNLTPKFRGCPGLTRDFRKQKTRVSARLDAGFGTSGYYLKLVFGAAAGMEFVLHIVDVQGLSEFKSSSMPPNVPPIFGNTLVRLPTRHQLSNRTGGNIRLLDAIVAFRTTLDGRTRTRMRRALVLDGKTRRHSVSLSSATMRVFEDQTQGKK